MITIVPQHLLLVPFLGAEGLREAKLLPGRIEDDEDAARVTQSKEGVLEITKQDDHVGKNLPGLHSAGVGSTGASFSVDVFKSVSRPFHGGVVKSA